MKILCDSGIVASRKEGKWMYYRLSDSAVREIIGFFEKMTKEIEK
jgi:ArsR family transcriptional regulator